MIADLGRRYCVALQTHEGRNKIASGLLIAAVLINLVASLVFPPTSPNGRGPATFLYGIGCGLLIVAIITYVASYAANRKAS